MSDKKIRIGYLGPEGTFSHEALLNFIAKNNIKAELVVFPTFAFVRDFFLEKLDLNMDKFFLPIENSVTGAVSFNVDLLTSMPYEKISIEAEYTESIRHCLGSIAQSFEELPEEIIIFSHQQPIEQCHEYINAKLANHKVRFIFTASTVEGVKQVKLREDNKCLAIASETAIKSANLNILARDIQDNPNNTTRFVLLGKDKTKPTSYDKTSIVITLPADKPGSLYEVLGVLAKSEPPINMTKIESRPTKDEMGEYWFFIDIEGHQDDPHIGKALNEIKAKSKEYKFLGSYPRFRK